MESNPQVIFEKLFGDGANEAERKARRQQSRSLLDSVIEQVASMKTQLPAGDRGRLTAYLDDVREIERRIEKSEKQMAAAKLDVPDTPTGAPENYRRPPQNAFRPSGAGIPRRDHPHLHPDAGSRAQQRGFSSHQHQRRIP